MRLSIIYCFDHNECVSYYYYCCVPDFHNFFFFCSGYNLIVLGDAHRKSCNWCRTCAAFRRSHRIWRSTNFQIQFGRIEWGGKRDTKHTHTDQTFIQLVAIVSYILCMPKTHLLCVWSKLQMFCCFDSRTYSVLFLYQTTQSSPAEKQNRFIFLLLFSPFFSFFNFVCRRRLN